MCSPWAAAELAKAEAMASGKVLMALALKSVSSSPNTSSTTSSRSSSLFWPVTSM